MIRTTEKKKILMIWKCKFLNKYFEIARKYWAWGGEGEKKNIYLYIKWEKRRKF